MSRFDKVFKLSNDLAEKRRHKRNTVRKKKAKKTLEEGGEGEEVKDQIIDGERQNDNEKKKGKNSREITNCEREVKGLKQEEVRKADR